MKSESKVDFLGRDVLSVRDFRREELEYVFEKVENLEEHRGSLDGALQGKLGALLFFEPSTRTYSSFQIAAEKLGLHG